MADNARLTAVDDRTFELVACDPGTEVSTPSAEVGVQDLLGLPAMRLGLMADAMESLDDDLELSWCAADGVVAPSHATGSRRRSSRPRIRTPSLV